MHLFAGSETLGSSLHAGAVLRSGVGVGEEFRSVPATDGADDRLFREEPDASPGVEKRSNHHVDFQLRWPSSHPHGGVGLVGVGRRRRPRKSANARCGYRWIM